MNRVSSSHKAVLNKYVNYLTNHAYFALGLTVRARTNQILTHCWISEVPRKVNWQLILTSRDTCIP